MKLNRKENTKRGIIFGTVNQIVTLLFPFLVQTITIKILGMEIVGIKGLFSSILSVLSLAELGFGSAIVYSMYRPIAEDDTETICALLKLYKKLYHIIGTVILFLGLAITPFLGYFIKGDYPANINIYLVFLLYLINTVSSYWMYAYKKSLLDAYQRVDVISKVGTLINTLMSSFQIILIFYLKNFYVYLVVSIIFTIINNLVISLCVDRMYPEIVCKGSISIDLLLDIRNKVMGLLIGKICTITRNTFDNIFMSMFLGLTQAAIYSNYFYILTALSGFTQIILSSLLSGVGNSIVLESKEKNYKDMMLLNFIYMIIGGWMSICMLCIYQPFMIIWTGKNYMFPFYVMILFPIYFYVGKMGDIRGVYSDAAGLFWENRYRNIIEIIANICLNYIFVRKWGSFGIMLATIITLLFIGFMGSTFIIFKYYFQSGMKEYLLRHVYYIIYTFFVAILTYCVCIVLAKELSWIGLIKRILICCIVPPIGYRIMLGKSNEYYYARQWILNVFRSRR